MPSKDNPAIFILGCGVMQIPALQLAVGQGWYVAAADANSQAPGVNLCHEFFHVDLKDTDGLIQAARSIRGGQGPDGVFTAGTDFSYSVAVVAQELGLPGHSVESARKASDKILMRQAFQKAGVPSTPFMEVNQTVDLERIDIPGPWVVKPADSMGSRGVMFIDNPDSLQNAIKMAISYSRTDKVILESYMDGLEYSLDALIHDGRFIRCGLADRIIDYPPCFIELGHTIPSAVDRSTADILWKVFEDGVSALNLRHGSAKGDLKLTSQGPRIGEIAARLSGGYMSGWTFPYSSGVQSTLGAMQLALGQPPMDMTPKIQSVCVERALVSIDGTIEQFDGQDDALHLEGIRDVFIRYNPGDTIKFPRNNVEKAANVIAVGPTRELAQEYAAAALRTLNLVLSPLDINTGRYLDESTSFPPDVFDTGDFFFELWNRYPPRPSRGARIHPFKIFVPDQLPECRDLTGRSIRDALNILAREGTIVIVSKAEESQPKQKVSDFWKAVVRGGLLGLRWFLNFDS